MTEPVRTLIDELLEAQRRLDTPVARFAAAHEHAPSSAPRSQLIPLSAPGPGEQYAFEVDLDSCTGCKACVAGCHSLNGLDDEETWRDVGLVLGGTTSRSSGPAFQQTITTACHHCEDPACLNGCPVLAYEKDPITGIVVHLDDQCIGCSYCVLKCPYDVPKYNERLGIVRKCDMCHGRLSAGEAPACVQACPTEAIRIVTVTTSSSKTAPESPVSTDPTPIEKISSTSSDYTHPTTRYVSKRPIPEGIFAADAATLRPQHPHWPLILMLTLMPMAVGCFTASAVFTSVPRVHVQAAGFSREISTLALLGWLAGAAGLFTSVFHLGKPLRAWRIFLGLRTSWLSREAVLFGNWFALATGALVIPALLVPSIAVGLVGLFCSVMIYTDTRRTFWRFTQAGPRFFGTALLIGVASALALGAPAIPAALVLAVSLVAKLAIETVVMRPLHFVDSETLPTGPLMTARLLAGPLRQVNGLRLAAGVLGGVLLPLLVATGSLPAPAAWVALACVILGELTERYLFFRAVDAPKMPGVPAS